MPNVPIPVFLPIPQDEDDFEELCLELLKLHWKRPGLERYGRKGQKQCGIDILDVGGSSPLYVAQCKLRKYGKTLSPKEIEEEVTAALTFELQIGKFAILTTAEVSTAAQRTIAEINQRHRNNHQFEVEIFAWGKITTLLEEHQSVRQAFLGSNAIAIDSRIGSKSSIVQDHIRNSAELAAAANLRVDIDEASDAITRREFVIALLLLNRISKRHDLMLATSHDKFRMVSNLGAAQLGLRRNDVAAKHFLEAVKLEPMNEVARINEALAYVLTGQNEHAAILASRLRTQYPASARLVVIWIASLPSLIILPQIEAELSEEMKTDGEVALAMAQRALLAMKLDSALAYAECASLKLPSSPRPLILIAQAKMGSIMQLERTYQKSSVDRSMLESDIESNIAQALSMADDSELPIRSEAIGLRADLRIVQKRFTEAEADATEALRLDPESTNPLLTLSHVMQSIKRNDQSVVLLERAFRKRPRPEAAFIYGRALLQRKSEGDVDLAISVLSSIVLESIREEFRPAVIVMSVDALLLTRDLDRAKQYLAAVEGCAAPSLTGVLRGQIALAEGDTGDAQALAYQARAQLSLADGPGTKELLANLFMKVGAAADALPLFQNLFEQKSEGFAWGQLLDCAGQLRRDDVVLQTCAELRRRGQETWEVIRFEVQYVERYSREKAIERLNEFLKLNPDHKMAQLSRSILGVQTQQPYLVKGEISQVPRVEELPLEYIIPAVHVLRYGGSDNDKVDYAYRYLRLHFDDVRAHEGFIISLLPFDPLITIPPLQEVVQVGSAVCISDDLSGVTRWYVLEETDKPVAVFEELSAQSSLAQEFIGKRVGDSVRLAEGKIENRMGVVRQIMPKYVRRYQDAMDQMSVRFGAKSSVESISIGSTEQDAAKAAQKVLDSVKNREATIEQVRKVYDELPVSLHLFGSRFGSNAYTALASLAQTNGQVVRNAAGFAEERIQATLALQTALYVVVDITAIATVRLIANEDLLFSNNRFRFRMTEGSFDELQQTLLGDLSHRSPGGRISYQDGAPSFIEESVGLKANRRSKDQMFLAKLKQVVEIVPVMSMSAYDPVKRESLEELFGRYGAEAMLLAANADSVLWTDDLLQALIGAKEFGTRRAWSELVVEQTLVAGNISSNEKDRIVASLIGMEYAAINFDAAAMIKAIDMAGGLPWQTPLKQFVEIFRKPTQNLLGLLGIFVNLITQLFRDSYLPETRSKLLRAILDALWTNVSSRSQLLQIRNATPQIFGLNLVGQTQFESTFDAWYEDQKSRIVLN